MDWRHLACTPMDAELPHVVVDSLTLRFAGDGRDGGELHELRATHVAEVLQGLVGISSDFEMAGAFGDDGPTGSEILVRPPEVGSSTRLREPRVGHLSFAHGNN